MEYVIMGFIKVHIQSNTLKTDEEEIKQIGLKQDLLEKNGSESYFCAINFNLRKFSMLKTVS